MSKKLKGGWLETTWHHLRRSPFQSLAAILVMWLNFLAATTLLVLIFGLSNLLNYFEGRPEVTAFLKDQADQEAVDQIRNQLSQLEGIKEVRYISKEEALKIYQEQNKDNPLLLEMVTADILPASLEISAVSPEYLTQVAEFLHQKSDLIEEVVFQRDVVERLSFWTRMIKAGGLAIVAFFSFVALVVIMVIVGMKIAMHRSEIAILRLLGASNFYIQAPFLLEGIIYGLIGSLLGIAVVGGLVFYWRPQIEAFFAPVVVLPQNNQLFLITILAELAVGAFLGLLAAWAASYRYLRR